MKIRTLLAVCALSLSCSAMAADKTPQELWRELNPLVERGAELVVSGKNLNEPTVIESVTFRPPEFQRIIRSCFKILGESDALDFLDAYRKKKAEISDLRKKIANATKDQMGAPDKNWNPLGNTKDSLTEKIDSYKNRISALETEMEQEKNAVLESFQAKGIPIKKDQFETLLSAADGRDTASIMAVAENIGQIQKSIEEKLADQDISLELIQIYTGMHMMCNYAYVYALDNGIEQIGTYLQKIDAIKQEAQDLLNQANQLVQGAGQREQKILASNKTSNQRTLKVAQLYGQYLAKQRNHLRSLKKKARYTTEVSVNTFKTVRNSLDLLKVIKMGDAELALLFQFQPPDLSLLYDDKLRQEFDAVTKRISE